MTEQQKMINEQILRCLMEEHTGKENAVKSKDLEKRFDVSGRTLRQKVNQMRQEGIPVCSDCTGYFYAENQDEINETVSWLNDLVTGVSNARTGLLFATLLPVPGTMSISIDVSVH